MINAVLNCGRFFIVPLLFLILLVKVVILLDCAISWMVRVLTNWRVKFLVVLSFIFVSHFLLGNQEQLVEKYSHWTWYIFLWERCGLCFLPSSIVSGNVKLFSPTASNPQTAHHSVRKFACKMIKINRWEHLVMNC